MNFIIFISVAIFIAYIVYTLADLLDDDIIKKRLNKIAKASPRINNKITETSHRKEQIIQIIEPITQNITKKINHNSIKQLLNEAGKPNDVDDIRKLIVTKVLYCLIGFFVAFFLVITNISASPMMKILLFLIVPLVLFRLPDMKLKRIGKIRQDEIKYNMPDSLDLLTVCVEAGLGIDMAFVRVSEEMSRTSPILAFEFNRINKDIRSGIPRAESYRNLALRNNVPDLKTFVALLIQTEKLGTSISQSLRIYSDTMRTKRRQKVETLAAQATIKMVIPLVLFVLPSIFVVLLGPAAINIVTMFMTQGK